jgi:hypothetical protein
MAPSKDNTGVPIKSVNASIPRASGPRPNCRPKIGDSKTKGKPEMSQCASNLALINQDRGAADKANCSKLPSWWSASHKRPKLNMLASKAATHKTPGPMRRKVSGSGPMANGNSAATTTKKKTAPNHSDLRRKARRRSRRNTPAMACHGLG